jgi:hypothetical protein
MAFQFAWVCSRTVSQHVAQHLRHNTDISCPYLVLCLQAYH